MTINLHPDEREALIALAEQERRDARAQAALLIRYELQRRGYLPAGKPDATQREPAEVEAGAGSGPAPVSMSGGRPRPSDPSRVPGVMDPFAQRAADDV